MTSQTEHKCSDCGGEMEEGFVFDKSEAAILVPRWLKGTPESYGKPFLGAGIKRPSREADCRTVQSFRCGSCGLLKQYALQRAEPPGWGRP